MGYAATLGGMRSLVASVSYLQAFIAFENTDWARVESLLTLTSSLQPRLELYWGGGGEPHGLRCCVLLRA
jgi:hypothetical protein